MKRLMMLFFVVVSLIIPVLFQNCSRVPLDQTSIDISNSNKNNGGGYPGLVVNGAHFAKPGETVNFTLSGGLPPYSYEVIAGDGQFTKISETEVSYSSPANSAEGVHSLKFSDANLESVNWELSISKIKIDDYQAGDGFGNSIQVLGEIMAVGASRDGDQGFLSGSVYIFKRGSTDWTIERKLNIPNSSYSFYGSSIWLTDKHLVVSSPSCLNPQDCKNAGTKLKTGKIYIYDRIGNDFIQSAVIEAFDGQLKDGFGSRVYLVGNTLAIRSMVDRGIFGNGAVYIYEYENSTWAFKQKIVSLTKAIDFGRKLILTDSHLIIASDGEVTAAGRLYLYKKDLITGEFLFSDATKQISTASYTHYADSIEQDGSKVYVSEGGGSAATTIHEYDLVNDQLVFLKSHRFAGSVVGFSYMKALSVKSDIMAIGNRLDTINGLSEAGSVSVFRKSGMDWVLVKKVTNEIPRAFEWFGLGLKIQNNEIFVTGRTKGEITVIKID